MLQNKLASLKDTLGNGAKKKEKKLTSVIVIGALGLDVLSDF